MRLTNGNYIDTRVKDASGAKGFVFWNEDCFQPRTYLVRADSWEDAYEWFLCDPRVEASLAVTDHFADYIDGWHGPAVAHIDDLGAAYMDGAAPGVTMNDNGTLLVSEAVNGRDLAGFVK